MPLGLIILFSYAMGFMFFMCGLNVQILCAATILHNNSHNNKAKSRNIYQWLYLDSKSQRQFLFIAVRKQRAEIKMQWAVLETQLKPVCC